MRRVVRWTSVWALVLACCSSAGGQPQPATSPAAEPQSSEAAGAVAVTVNGHSITEAHVDEVLKAIISQRMGGMAPPEGMMTQARQRMRPQILESLIADQLLDDDAAQAGITVTAEEFAQEFDKRLRTYLLRSGTTQAEFEEQLQNDRKTSLPAFVAERVAEPTFQRMVRHLRLLGRRFPDETRVADADIQARYDRDLKEVYSKPDRVRASHILLGVEESATDEQKTEARKQADQVLAEVRKPDADFAALAGQHSTCPSRTRGGDLGFFPREGAMVEPFAAAAFAMKVGEISDVVETRFGYHIIKVTERKGAEVVTLEQARDAIVEELQAEKAAQLRDRHVAELRKAAKIEYATGAQPATQPAQE